jgi:Fe-S-cluster containining protein
MELSEATRLADTFVTSLLFRVHSLPVSERSEWAVPWWRDRKSRIPLRPALDEAERHLRHFASRRIDKRRDRQVFFDISAIVDDDGAGRCPALTGSLCGIYETRPLTCRTVPLHYSRAPSTLQTYLDQFTATPDYLCETTALAPVILDGNRVIDPQIRDDREQAVALAKADRGWKERLLSLMDGGDQAAAAGLPTYDAVLNNSDKGYATMLPMIVAWRVAASEGFLSRETLRELCRKQAGLIKSRIARNVAGPVPKELLDSLAVYEFELSRGLVRPDA